MIHLFKDLKHPQPLPGARNRTKPPVTTASSVHLFSLESRFSSGDNVCGHIS